jgi:hypothetical protein
MFFAFTKFSLGFFTNWTRFTPVLPEASTQIFVSPEPPNELHAVLPGEEPYAVRALSVSMAVDPNA